ncbi:MAG: aminotransferase class I/II-fold pyridoxal phosphate-dependent enzyme [Ruthenibacterium lactatiformans]
MKIKDFGVEMWMNAYENDCTYNLAETCVESLTVEQLLELGGCREQAVADILGMKLTYGAIEGSPRLRMLIAGLYEKQTPENVITAHGAIGANHLVIEALAGPGDEVVSVLPTYQQHYSIPEALGAEVHILPLRSGNVFLPDLDELRGMVNKNTKLICINNPNNPTGALMEREFLQEVAGIARSVDAWLLCDEVYRGLNTKASRSRPLWHLYERNFHGQYVKDLFIGRASLGWIAGPKALLEQVSRHRDYSTISCGMIDEYLAGIALEHKEAVIARNRAIVTGNLAVLERWLKGQPKLSFVKPRAGTTAFLKMEFDMPSADFCRGLLAEKGVLLVPGSVMDREGYLRIGYANTPEVIAAGLDKMGEYLAELPL